MCECCNDHYPADDMTHDFYDNVICNGCADYNYRNAFCATNNYQSLLHEDEVIHCMSNDEYYQDTPRCLEYNGIAITLDNEYQFKEACLSVLTEPYGGGVQIEYASDADGLVLLCERNGNSYYVQVGVEVDKVQTLYETFFGPSSEPLDYSTIEINAA
jgi:hypothetical protein